MHGQNVEFGHLIPGKFCFWREIFAILRGYLSFRWIFCIFSSLKMLPNLLTISILHPYPTQTHAKFAMLAKSQTFGVLEAVSKDQFILCVICNAVECG